MVRVIGMLFILIIEVIMLILFLFLMIAFVFGSSGKEQEGSVMREIMKQYD